MSSAPGPAGGVGRVVLVPVLDLGPARRVVELAERARVVVELADLGRVATVPAVDADPARGDPPGVTRGASWLPRARSWRLTSACSGVSAMLAPS